MLDSKKSNIDCMSLFILKRMINNSDNDRIVWNARWESRNKMIDRRGISNDESV